VSELTDILICPRCSEALADTLACQGCGIAFPTYDGVPWLMPDPSSARLEWRNRWQMALADLERRHRAARDALAKNPSLSTRVRLEQLAEGYAAQQRSIRTLLKSLGLAQPADLETYIALKTRLPTALGLNSYEANVFRDWVWGTKENKAARTEVNRALLGLERQSVLVLGAGAGRLAYDLHQHPDEDLDNGTGTGSTVALEINPYLAAVLQRMVAGDSLNLTEFPMAPRSGTCSAMERTLKAPSPVREGFEVVLADALHAPFAAGSFDVVITPWLLDVIDAKTTAVMAEVNRLLKPGGHWIYHGSLAFNRPDVVENVNLEELLELADDCGFENVTTTSFTGPYLDCPDSRHGRVEEMLTLCHRKVADVEIETPHQNLPDWIATGKDPIPLLPAFQNQAMATRVHAFIMSLIDGNRTLEDMAAVMEAQQLMPSGEAEVAIRGFLIKMFDEASAAGGFR
jgi:SAM-dependent methyltransferase/uncharacterized protein YbaR (Trm112 family)